MSKVNFYYPWQAGHWNSLTRDKKTFPPTLLVWGQKGLGKEHFAQQLSRWLLCEQATTTPCGHCNSCRWWQSGMHPDYLEIGLEPGASSIHVDAVRKIQTFSEKKSHSGQYRVIFISPVEAMNSFAANALLKILEEPFEKTIFLLISHHLSWVLPTVRSRCQKLYFPSLSEKAFKQAMLAFSQDTHDLYQLSHGAPLAFKTLEEQQAIVIAKRKIFQLLENCFTKKVSSIETVEQIKIIEKETHVTVANVLEILFLYAYQRVRHTKDLVAYVFYDKLLAIQRQVSKGIPINWVIWLEDLLTTG